MIKKSMQRSTAEKARQECKIEYEKKIHTAWWFHLYEVLKEAKQICGEKWFPFVGGGLGHKGTFWNDRKCTYLDRYVCTYQSSANYIVKICAFHCIWLLLQGKKTVNTEL